MPNTASVFCEGRQSCGSNLQSCTLPPLGVYCVTSLLGETSLSTPVGQHTLLTTRIKLLLPPLPPVFKDTIHYMPIMAAADFNSPSASHVVLGETFRGRSAPFECTLFVN